MPCTKLAFSLEHLYKTDFHQSVVEFHVGRVVYCQKDLAFMDRISTRAKEL
jgi:hypothetical protein